MTQQILEFFRDDFYVACLLVAALCVISAALILGSMKVALAWWAGKEDERHKQSIEDLARSLKANRESVEWSRPAVKGGEWQKRRVS